MDTKLLDISYYFCQNANNGLLRVIDNISDINVEDEKNILSQKNLERIDYLYSVVKSDIKSFLVKCLKILEEQGVGNLSLEYRGVKQSKTEFTEQFIYVSMPLEGRGNRPVPFSFYITIYYQNDKFMRESIDKPLIVFSLYLETDRYNAEKIRKGYHRNKYANIDDDFGTSICAYDTMTLSEETTVGNVVDNAYTFLYNYLCKKSDIVSDAKI
ncbi:MAG: hypothetical protein MSA07_08735 [Mucispirillum sp.]|nr:hypothetical protein [Mucispirillum sp.]